MKTESPNSRKITRRKFLPHKPSHKTVKDAEIVVLDDTEDLKESKVEKEPLESPSTPKVTTTSFHKIHNHLSSIACL